MEKRKAHYDLKTVQQYIAEAGIDAFTRTAKQGVEDMALTEEDAVNVVLSLKPGLLYKSMSHPHQPHTLAGRVSRPVPQRQNSLHQAHDAIRNGRDSVQREMKMELHTRAPRYCLQCDDGTVLEHGVKDLTETRKGIVIRIPSVSGWHCPKCGECEFDPGEGRRHSEEISKAILADTAREVREIRKKLGLKQSEAAQLFGGGINAFSEYELGKTKPHRSTLQLLHLLDRHPELLRELEPA
jgi:HTH-type transcriptional regulator/antitoxin MqsA